MYSDPNFVRLAANAMRWVTKETNERRYRFDLFLSFSSRNRDQGRLIVAAAERLGLTIYQDEKNIQSGAIWAEEIRAALVESREMALLASPDAMRSEWVQTEWGAAWVLRRTITPILHQMPAEDLPERLRQRQVIDFYRYEEYLQEVRERGRG